MNAIEMKIIGAIQSGQELPPHVTHDEDGCARVMLHGNRIACVDLNRGIMTLSDQGYLTLTTTSHLNALLEAFAPDYRTCIRQGVRQLVDGRSPTTYAFGQWVAFKRSNDDEGKFMLMQGDEANV